jgi:putative SOS response-associated peptidase YedK
LSVCGRYELHSHPAAIALAFGLAHAPELPARYNIAPMTEVPVVRLNAQGERELVPLRWGLVPRRARDPAIGNKLINARGETLADRPSFRIAFRRHRCLLPADGFYEWIALGTGERARKQPVRIAMKDGRPFGLGGLFERWLSPEGEVLDTCTIVTTPANALLRPVGERMPLIVGPADYDRWLDPAAAEVQELVAPYPPEGMTYYPVSTRVNAVRNDSPALLEPVTIEAEPPADDSPPHEPEQESLF